MNDKNKRRVVLIVVSLLSATLGAMGTGYALKWKPIKPDFTFTIDTKATTIKLVDEEGSSLGEIRRWTADPIVVRIKKHED